LDGSSSIFNFSSNEGKRERRRHDLLIGQWMIKASGKSGNCLIVSSAQSAARNFQREVTQTKSQTAVDRRRRRAGDCASPPLGIFSLVRTDSELRCCWLSQSPGSALLPLETSGEERKKTVVRALICSDTALIEWI
jgi:hypothetical protein